MNIEWKRLSYSLPMKLKRLKEPVSKWNREVFGDIDTHIKKFSYEVTKWDATTDSRPLSNEENLKVATLNPELER